MTVVKCGIAAPKHGLHKCENQKIHQGQGWCTCYKLCCSTAEGVMPTKTCYCCRAAVCDHPANCAAATTNICVPGLLCSLHMLSSWHQQPRPSRQAVNMTIAGCNCTAHYSSSSQPETYLLRPDRLWLRSAASSSTPLAWMMPMTGQPDPIESTPAAAQALPSAVPTSAAIICTDASAFVNQASWRNGAAV